MDRLRSVFKIERGEELPVLFLFLYLTLVLTSYLIIKAARDALFLARFSALTLPYIYIGVAVLIGLVVVIYLRISARVGLTKLITGTLVFFIANVLLLWWAGYVHWSPLAAVFYVWSSIFGVTVPTQVWTVANRVLDVRQAKRLFPLISSGGIVGAVAGGLFAAATAKRIGTYHLLLVLVPLLVLCVILARLLLRRYAHTVSGVLPVVSTPVKRESGERLWNPLSRSAYLRTIAVMLALSAIVTLVVDFQLKFVVKQLALSMDQMTAFFGLFYALLNFLALLLQLVAGSRLVERFGIRATLFILPTALITGTLLLLAYPLRLWAALVLKGSDQTLRYSIDKSTVELLYLPVPQSLKTEAKAIIDMMVQRFADGIGGALLVVMTRVLGMGLTGVGALNLVLISVWLWVALRARKEYVSSLKASIYDRSALAESARRLVVDESESTVALRSMLESDSSVVRLRPDQPMSELIEYLKMPDRKVRLSALVCLARQEMDPNTLRKHLSVFIDNLNDTPEQWNDFIVALGKIHHPTVVEFYVRLLTHPSAEVRKQATFSAGRGGKRELVPFLVRLLGDPAVTREARRALREYGPRVLGTLADVMKDPQEDIEIRRNIPRILAHVPQQETVDILLASLPDCHPEVVDRCIRALNKLRLSDTSFRFNREKVDACIHDQGERALWCQRALTSLYPEDQSADRLAQLLRDKIEYGRDNVFRLLALILPAATLHAAYQVLKQEDRLKKADVAEYLDNVLPTDLKNWVLPLVEPKTRAPCEPQDRREILEQLLKSPDPAIRECTAGAIARNRWSEVDGSTPIPGPSEEEFLK